MANQYVLSSGSNSILVITDRRASQTGPNGLLIPPGLNVELSGTDLVYWTGRFIKTDFFKVKLSQGKPYEHIFEIGNLPVKISSKDQKTFRIEM